MKRGIIAALFFLLLSCRGGNDGAEYGYLYAMTDCVEWEMWLTGDSIPLSRSWLRKKAEAEKENGGSKVKRDGREALRLIDRYGIIPHVTPAQHEDGSETFFFYGMQYTPAQFAESIMYCQNWQFYDSPKVGRKEMLRLTTDALRRGKAVYYESKGEALCIIGTKKEDGKQLLVCRRTGEDDREEDRLLSLDDFLKQAESIGINEPEKESPTPPRR